jgi:hypothetical protein
MGRLKKRIYFPFFIFLKNCKRRKKKKAVPGLEMSKFKICVAGAGGGETGAGFAWSVCSCVGFIVWFSFVFSLFFFFF